MQVVWNAYQTVISKYLDNNQTVVLPRDSLSHSLLRLCRVLVSDWLELGSVLDVFHGRTKVLSLVNEARAIRLALDILNNKLAAFSTGIEDDLLQLAAIEYPSTLANVIQLRMKEKEFLRLQRRLLTAYWSSWLTLGVSNDVDQQLYKALNPNADHKQLAASMAQLVPLDVPRLASLPQHLQQYLSDIGQAIQWPEWATRHPARKLLFRGEMWRNYLDMVGSNDRVLYRNEHHSAAAAATTADSSSSSSSSSDGRRRAGASDSAVLRPHPYVVYLPHLSQETLPLDAVAAAPRCADERMCQARLAPNAVQHFAESWINEKPVWVWLLHRQRSPRIRPATSYTHFLAHV